VSTLPPDGRGEPGPTSRPPLDRVDREFPDHFTLRPPRGVSQRHACAPGRRLAGNRVYRAAWTFSSTPHKMTTPADGSASTSTSTFHLAQKSWHQIVPTEHLDFGVFPGECFPCPSCRT
jgi:hypothetical protein